MSDATELPIVGCKREGCPVAEGGRCALDHENPGDCDQVIRADDASAESYRTLDRGVGLTFEEIATMQQEHGGAPTAGLIGARGSGKTTFLAMLYHKFLSRHSGFRGHRFMDSASFLALNQRLHYADKKAQRQQVKMPRTSLEEEPGFHLQTKNAEGDVRHSYWIDIPGEDLEQFLSKGTAAWDRSRGLARATHVLAFIDLQVLSSETDRGPHVEQLLDALTRSIQTETWDNRHLMVVFSKADEYLQQSGDSVSSTASKIRRRFSDDFESIATCDLHSLGEVAESERSIGTIWDWVHGIVPAQSSGSSEDAT